jgi:hypothetical protein
MKLYVAFRTDAKPKKKLASGSFTKLKERVKETKLEDSEWTIVLFDVKPNLDNCCQLVENVAKLEGEWAKDFRLMASGLREVK